jgi:hypothetical protein
MDSLSDIITLQNIDNEDFDFAYDKRPYIIRAGQVRRFPRFLANHALKHLIDKILTKRKIRTNHETHRADLAEKIVIDVENYDDAPVRTEADMLNEKIDTLNRPSDLENVLKKHRDTKPVDTEEVVTTTAAPEPPVMAPETTAPPTPEPAPIDEDEDEETKTPAPDAPKDMPLKPSRSELMDYAKNTLKMNTDDKKTKASFGKMTVDELIKGLDYPYPPAE